MYAIRSYYAHLDDSIQAESGEDAGDGGLVLPGGIAGSLEVAHQLLGVGEFGFQLLALRDVVGQRQGLQFVGLQLRDHQVDAAQVADA